MQKNLNIEKIIFKVVQMKFLAMHITNQKLSFDIFMVRNLQNIFMEHDLNILMIFVIKEKCIILTHTMYCCLLLQIYLCYLWLLLCSRVTINITSYLYNYILNKNKCWNNYRHSTTESEHIPGGYNWNFVNLKHKLIENHPNTSIMNNSEVVF